jgi:hypothetical protein
MLSAMSNNSPSEFFVFPKLFFWDLQLFRTPSTLSAAPLPVVNQPPIPPTTVPTTAPTGTVIGAKTPLKSPRPAPVAAPAPAPAANLPTS